jgi:hypothetical protein
MGVGDIFQWPQEICFVIGLALAFIVYFIWSYYSDSELKQIKKIVAKMKSQQKAWEEVMKERTLSKDKLQRKIRKHREKVALRRERNDRQQAPKK